MRIEKIAKITIGEADRCPDLDLLTILCTKALDAAGIMYQLRESGDYSTVYLEIFKNEGNRNIDKVDEKEDGGTNN